jgi:pimeloyl-ACP methyl ester carboxylesterase
MQSKPLATGASSGTVRSADGTRIAFDRTGEGPALILVEPAAHYRDFSSFTGLGPLLAREFTVYTYDRRGRGGSADTAPYAPAREVDDLDALIAEAGGAACVYGYSSGALLAMHAAARGSAIRRLAVMEPPLDDNEASESDLTKELATLVAAGRREDAVRRFHESIGVPPEFVAELTRSPVWPKMVSVAPTLVYDCAISDATTRELLQSIAVPTLVLDSAGSTDDLTGSAAAVADLLPGARHKSLPGAWHTVPDEMLAPALIDFFRL